MTGTGSEVNDPITNPQLRCWAGSPGAQQGLNTHAACCTDMRMGTPCWLAVQHKHLYSMQRFVLTVLCSTFSNKE